MNNAETTYTLDGIDYKAIANTDGQIEIYDLSVWASEGIERFVGYAQSGHLTTAQRAQLALACLLANGYEIEFSCGGVTQVCDKAEGKCRFLITSDAIVRNGESTYETCVDDVIGMIYF